MDDNSQKPPAPKRVMVKPAAPAEKKYKSPLEHPENKRKIDHFIAEHAPLIKRQINKLKNEGKIPSSVDPNDLVVAGFNGIMQAVHRYDAKAGTAFAHFANTHIRNRILDHIVASGDIPKELMVQAKRYAAFKASMKSKQEAAANPATAAPATPAATPQAQTPTQPAIAAPAAPKEMAQPAPAAPEPVKPKGNPEEDGYFD